MKKILVLLIPFILCGCWNYKELNQLAIVSGMAIEKENDEYVLTAQIINSQKSDVQDSSNIDGNKPVNILKAKGKTVHEALSNMALISPKDLYIGHNKLFIIDEEVAKNGIEKIIDFLIRQPESHKQFQVLISKGDKASNILEVLTPIEDLPAKDILLTLHLASNQKGNVTEVTYDELLSNIHKEGLEPTIPVIEITKSNNNLKKGTDIKLSGMSVFKRDKLIGYLNYEESLGYNLIRNNIKKDVINFKCNGNYGSFEIVSITTNFKVDIVNEKPLVNINTEGSLYLSEMNCDLNISKNSERKKLMDIINKKVETIISETIYNVKSKYKVDIFGFGYYLYQNNYKYWVNNKNNWDNLFNNIDLKINVNLNITKKGSILEPAKEG